MIVAALDHVGVVSRDLPALADRFERLGFLLTPFARQSDGRIGNRCAMLRNGYIELLAVVDPRAGSATLDRLLARYVGVHILAFAMADEQATLARLRRAGVAASGAVRLDRAIDDADPDGPRARFAFIFVADYPEGRINLVRHLTPELLWQDRWLRHPNNAAELTEAILAVADPAEAAARLSRVAGCPAVPDPAGGFALELRHGRVRLLSDAGLSAVLPDIHVPALPSIVGITVETSDANQAIGRLVAERGIACRRDADRLVIDPGAAGGVAVRFVVGT